MNKNNKTLFRIFERLFIIAVVIAIAVVAVRAVDKKTTGSDGAEDGCPKDMVFVPFSSGSFCMDKFEASPGKDCPYSNPSVQPESRTNLDYRECQPVSEIGKMPWRFISQNQAAIACAKAGKRLPTNKEWQAAAFGTPDPASGWTAEDCQVNDNWDDQPGATGSGNNCVSAAGAYDLIGNLWEWVDGTVEAGEYRGKVLPDAGYVLAVDDEAMPSQTAAEGSDDNYYGDYFWLKTTESRGIARGGYFANKAEAGQFAVYAVSPPSFAGVGIGFRCVK